MSIPRGPLGQQHSRHAAQLRAPRSASQGHSPPDSPAQDSRSRSHFGDLGKGESRFRWLAEAFGELHNDRCGSRCAGRRAEGESVTSRAYSAQPVEEGAPARHLCAYHERPTGQVHIAVCQFGSKRKGNLEVSRASSGSLTLLSANFFVLFFRVLSALARL